MSNHNLIDLAALSDPTDTHSLEELRAHLEDGDDLEPAPPAASRTAWIMAHFDMITGKYDETPPWQASERSGGDGV